MLNRRYAKRGLSRLVWCTVALFWATGCAGVTIEPASKQWRCDDEADAAVKRQQWELALSLHDTVLEQAPQNCLTIYHLGYIHGKLGDRHQEAVQYERAVQCGLTTDDRLFFNLGMAYAELDLMDRALSAFERAVSLNDRSVENHFGLGLVAGWSGQIERAETALARAVALDARHWEARMLLTRIYLEEGHLDAARPHLEHLLENNPGNPDVEELQQIYEDRRITTFER